MQTTKIGYNITTYTARDEMILQDVKHSCQYWEDYFTGVIPNLTAHLESNCSDFWNLTINHKYQANKESINHSIVYEIQHTGNINKQLIKDYIYQELDKAFSEILENQKAKTNV